MVTCSSRLRPGNCCCALSNTDGVFYPTPCAPGTRFALRVEYHGGLFHGWQAQPHLDCHTVQETLEAALCRIAAAPVRTVCAGRTDTGVHGFGQIVHFDDPVGRSAKAWVMGVNSQLPDAVRVHWAKPVPVEFHARFSALTRRYRYVIANTAIRPAHMATLATWYRKPLDAGLMHAAAQPLLGEHDFSAFRAASCQSSTPWRCIDTLDVFRVGDWVVIDIEANAFLHHMVRNIAGSLMMVGAGLRDVDWPAELLRGADRTLAADTAPGTGLYLVAVTYPPAFGLPETPPGPMFITVPFAHP